MAEDDWDKNFSEFSNMAMELQTLRQTPFPEKIKKSMDEILTRATQHFDAMLPIGMSENDLTEENLRSVGAFVALMDLAIWILENELSEG